MSCLFSLSIPRAVSARNWVNPPTVFLCAYHADADEIASSWLKRAKLPQPLPGVEMLTTVAEFQQGLVEHI